MRQAPGALQLTGGKEDGEEEGVRGSRKGKGMQKDIEGEGEEGHEGEWGGKGRGGDGEQLCREQLSKIMVEWA